MIFDQGNYGKEMAGLVRDGLEQNGVKVLVFEPIESGAENYSELIGKLEKQSEQFKWYSCVFQRFSPRSR